MKRLIWLTLLVSSLLLLMIGCSSKQNLATVNNNDKIKQMKLGNSDEDSIQLNLYFDGSKEESKANVVQEQRVLIKEEVLGELIVQELLKGPSVGNTLKSIFPKNIRILSFSISDGTAYVNFSNVAKFNMSLTEEEVYLKSLASSLCELESVLNVKVLIENKDVDTLGGNYDASKPFSAETIKLLKNETE